MPWPAGCMLLALPLVSWAASVEFWLVFEAEYATMEAFTDEYALELAFVLEFEEGLAEPENEPPPELLLPPEPDGGLLGAGLGAGVLVFV